jgi:hypothetical protein
MELMAVMALIAVGTIPTGPATNGDSVARSNEGGARQATLARL